MGLLRGWLLIAAFVVVLSGADKAPTLWTASLDDPPATRWAHIQKAYASEIRELVKEYTDGFSKEKLEMYAWMMDLGFLDADLKADMRTLAEVANITYAEAAFINFMYEYNAYCTSVIVQTAQGTIIHGRNLDYGLGNLLRKTLIDVDVYRNNTVLFKMSWFPWYLGINTGMRPGQYSLSLNQRDSGYWAENVVALLLGFQGNFFRSRTALTNSATYAEASAYLEKANTVTTSYDIIASPQTGSIITRNRASTARVTPLEEGGWYLVQTNHDWWTPSPVGDNRTETAEAFLNKTGREKFTEESMFELLSQFPVENPTTVFTTVMVPESGYFRTIIRE